MIFVCLQKNHHHRVQIIRDVVTVVSKELVLPNVTMEDKGWYRCKAELSTIKIMITSAKVLVFGELALNVCFLLQYDDNITLLPFFI